MVIGLPNIEKEEKIYEGCIYGKMHRLPFPKTAWRANMPLELVHADICGPTRTPTFQNKKYFLLFVDDFSRMMWVYFLEQKSEAFSTFLQFKQSAERQSGHPLKTLRIDRGGEFLSEEFKNYCKNKGIKRQLTVRYTPQQNGMAERKNHTIIEMARSMLKAKGLPNNFWVEAVNTVVYILNRSPTKVVPNRTPYEAWNGRKPDVNFFRVFGSIAYSLIPSQHREKFDEKREKYIFIGYSDESKAYRLFDPKTKQLVISRDVHFNEMKAWEWENKNSHEAKSFEVNERRNDKSSSLVSPPTNADQNFTGNNSDSESEPESPPRRVCSLEEIYDSCNLAFFSCEPLTFQEAEKNEVWQKAMDEEMTTIVKNYTWELVDCPKQKDVVGLKWIYKTKFKEDGSIQKHKARLVAKGYS
uniref:Putative polyprotein n=1 Tax=Davidia involucrata TaxID=16924 RepID=A0A5B7BAZ6_DAVIN